MPMLTPDEGDIIRWYRRSPSWAKKIILFLARRRLGRVILLIWEFSSDQTHRLHRAMLTYRR